MKTLLLAAAVLLAVVCGDTTAAPDTTPLKSDATATPSPPAIKSPAPAQTVVAFLNAPLTVARGHDATLQVKTAPTTSCSIEVDYSSGASIAAGLLPKTSTSTGTVSWTWKVGANTAPGSWPITVRCGDGTARTQIAVT